MSGEVLTVDRSLSVEAAAKRGWLAVEGTFPVVSLFLLLLRSLVAVNVNATYCDSTSKHTNRKNDCMNA